jgi:hypothetical protein
LSCLLPMLVQASVALLGCICGWAGPQGVMLFEGMAI